MKDGMMLVLIAVLMFIIGYEIKEALKEINKNIETLISLEGGAQ
jgi:Flp pilus assembly pilin Flp